MFQKTRLKLTAWYLLIIMIISLSFSTIIFKVQMAEVQRFAQAQRIRIERQFPPANYPFQKPPLIDPDLIAETEERLFFNLILINGIIFVVSGGLAYFLAGKTLRPIKDMVEDQDRFISDSSHELRTPLTSLKSAMEVALMDNKLSLIEAKKLIRENIQDVDRLQKLTDSLIKLSRGNERRNDLVLSEVNLENLINMAINKIKPLADQKNISIKTKIIKAKVRVDQEKIENLLVIIMDNAIKYSPSQKQITIKAIKTGKNIQISIADNGQGIDKKDLPYIFDRFFRSDNSRSNHQTNGFGLGLSIAQMIIEKHHGDIQVVSTKGEGSTFTVTLPQNFS